jgi:predicted nucleic acid-binding protein
MLTSDVNPGVIIHHGKNDGRHRLPDPQGSQANPARRGLVDADDGFLDVYREVTHGMAARGNLVPDAHVAALLRQHGVTVLYTADADFRRFDFLDVRNPLDG